MNGLYLRRSGTHIEKVEKKTEILELIGKGDGVEVMLQTIKSGQMFSIAPGDSADLMEFFFILDGTVSYDENGKVTFLKKGDYFYVRKIKETAYFKSESEVKMLYISSRPMYHMLSNEIECLGNIMKTIRDKDMYTHKHDMRVVGYCVKIGEVLGLSRESVENLYYAALFHDIGKLKIPDEILKKPGKLTKEEFEYIKMHPSDGREMLNSTFLKDIGYIVEQHHERIDGSGYPFGLKDSDISIEAKIIAVVDSFDAMTSDRPYREAMSADQALDELKSLAGKQYDKCIVHILEQLVKNE